MTVVCPELVLWVHTSAGGQGVDTQRGNPRLNQLMLQGGVL